MATPAKLTAKLCLLTLAGGACGAASAQNLDMSGTAGAASDGRPSSGMTQASVEATYGTPANRIAAVGEPPISRWEYAEYIVYFEYDRVIHAVRKR